MAGPMVFGRRHRRSIRGKSRQGLSGDWKFALEEVFGLAGRNRLVVKNVLEQFCCCGQLRQIEVRSDYSRKGRRIFMPCIPYGLCVPFFRSGVDQILNFGHLFLLND